MIGRARRFAAIVLAVLLGGGASAHAGDRQRPKIVFQSERLDAVTTAEDDPTDPKLEFTNIGNMRLYLSNAGTFGTAFTDREKPAMEWPANSGIDHLVRGAVWVGAVNAATGQVHVTTGGRDAYYQDAIFQHSQFTPIAGKPVEYSRLRTSPFFRPGTVSDENFHTIYVDTLPVVSTGPEPPHEPLGLRIVQETYSWGFDPVDDFVIVELNVVNVGEAGLQDVWIGIYSEMVTNNRNSFRTWPPGGSWFDFQDPYWDTERNMLVNHNARGGLRGATQYGAIKVLGSGGSGPYGRGPDSLATKSISMTAWSWAPSQFFVWTDSTLYDFMSTGVAEFPEGIPNPDDTEINPVTVISVGPFPLLASGDTTQVVFAFLAGEDPADLERNAFWAQKAYNDKYALPSPPSSPIMQVFPRHREVVVAWSNDPETELDPASRLPDFQGYRIYLSEDPRAAAYRLVHEFDEPDDGIGFDTGFGDVLLEDPYVTAAGDTLRYGVSIGNIPDGFKRYLAITSYDHQEGDPPTLEGGVLSNSIYFISGPDEEQAQGKRVSVFPNPYRGESMFDGRDADGSINPRKRVLYFVNLPPRATIRIYTLAGDLVREYHFDAATYTAAEIGGIRPDRDDLAIGNNVIMSGSMAGFDLLNADGQEIGSGLYLFSVRDETTGETQQGKFMVIK